MDVARRGSKGLSPNVVRTGIVPDGPVKPQPPDRGGNVGCLAILLIGALIFAIAKCGSSSTSPSDAPAVQASAAQESLSDAVARQDPPPVETLNRGSARTGAGRVAAVSIEGLDGELVYSQNCYDVLGRDFSWRKLDECGGFDVRAADLLGDDEAAGEEKAVAWFDREAAAGRYLKAAMAAGLDAAAADERLAALQAIAVRPTTRRDAGRVQADGGEGENDGVAPDTEPTPSDSAPVDRSSEEEASAV